MSPKKVSGMLDNHCDIGLMLIKSRGKVDDWGTKTRAWGYVLAFILDSIEDMDKTHYFSEEQYNAFDASLLRTLGTGKALKDLLEESGE